MADTPFKPGDGQPGRPLRIAPASGEVGRRPPRKPARPARELDEHPSESDIERFSGVTRTCPACKKEVFDDSEVCYHCGEAFERTAPGTGRPPTWVIVAAVLIVAALLAPVVWSLVK